MAVVDEEKVARADRAEAERPKAAEREAPTGLAGVISWPGRKLSEGRAFFSEVRSELKKVTWPSRKEVYSTTLVVIATSILFGFYLWGLDLVFSRVMSLVLAR
jgi:preprotein translocase subunit SecE